MATDPPATLPPEEEAARSGRPPPLAPADPFARAGLALEAAERARLAEPARLFEALLEQLRAAPAEAEPAVIFVPPAGGER